MAIRGTILLNCDITIGNMVSYFSLMLKHLLEIREKLLLVNDTVNCWEYTALVTDELMSMGRWWNDIGMWKPKYSEKTCPENTFSTINRAGPDLELNPVFRGDKPAADHLSYGTALVLLYSYTKHQ